MTSHIETVRYTIHGYEFGVAVEGWPDDVVATNAAEGIKTYLSGLSPLATHAIHTAMSYPKQEQAYRADPSAAPPTVQALLTAETDVINTVKSVLDAQASVGRVYVFAGTAPSS